jgi:hypothetical protein
MSLKSTPALNTGSTAASTTADTDTSRSAAASSWHSSVRIAPFNAFLASGRSISIVRTDPSSVTLR